MHRCELSSPKSHTFEKPVGNGLERAGYTPAIRRGALGVALDMSSTMILASRSLSSIVGIPSLRCSYVP